MILLKKDIYFSRHRRFGKEVKKLALNYLVWGLLYMWVDAPDGRRNTHISKEV